MVSRTDLFHYIDIVVNKMMNLEEADHTRDIGISKIESQKGIIARDFGIMEWDWPQGVGLYGLNELAVKYEQHQYNNFLERWFNTNIEQGLPSKNINTTAPFITLIEFSDRTQNKAFMDMCIMHAQWLMNELPKTEEGGFQHVTSAIGNRNGVSLNENELWIDTLFMAVLFLAKMAKKFNNYTWLNETILQMHIHIKYLYEKKNGLFYHGWSFNTHDNFGGIFWCRGNSWFTLGIMEYLEVLGDLIESGDKQFFVSTFKAQVNKLCTLQSKDGLWHTVLDDPTSYTEVSGSAAIIAGIFKGIKVGILDSSYLDYARRGLQGIIKNISEDGLVQNVSAGTGMGHDAIHYKKIIKSPMAYGQSLVIKALIQGLDFAEN